MPQMLSVPLCRVLNKVFSGEKTSEVLAQRFYSLLRERTINHIVR